MSTVFIEFVEFYCKTNQPRDVISGCCLQRRRIGGHFPTSSVTRILRCILQEQLWRVPPSPPAGKARSPGTRTYWPPIGRRYKNTCYPSAPSRLVADHYGRWDWRLRWLRSWADTSVRFSASASVAAFAAQRFPLGTRSPYAK